MDGDNDSSNSEISREEDIESTNAEISGIVEVEGDVGVLTGDVRVVGRSENPGVPVLFGGLNLPPLN